MKPQIVRHGEVIIKPVSELPKGAVLEVETKKFIVAHSETGHHHVLTTDLSKFKVYSFNGERYLEVTELSNLIHEKTGKDTHTPHKIPAGFYKVVIKQAFDFFEKKMKAVRD